MKVLDQLKTLAVGYQYAEHKETKYFHLQPDISQKTELPQKDTIFETSAKLVMRQVSSGYPNEFEKKLIQERAAQSIARELYGDVADELYDIMDQLYEDGPKYDDKVLEMIKKLIDKLELRDFN